MLGFGVVKCRIVLVFGIAFVFESNNENACVSIESVLCYWRVGLVYECVLFAIVSGVLYGTCTRNRVVDLAVYLCLCCGVFMLVLYWTFHMAAVSASNLVDTNLVCRSGKPTI